MIYNDLPYMYTAPFVKENLLHLLCDIGSNIT